MAPGRGLGTVNRGISKSMIPSPKSSGDETSFMSLPVIHKGNFLKNRNSLGFKEKKIDLDKEPFKNFKAHSEKAVEYF